MASLKRCLQQKGVQMIKAEVTGFEKKDGKVVKVLTG